MNMQFLMWQKIDDTLEFWRKNEDKIKPPFIYLTVNGRLAMSKTRIMNRIMCRHYGITHYCLIKLPEDATL